jgi:hypothetical protein
MHYNPGWEPGSMKTLAAHGLAGGIVQDRMGGSFGAGFLAGSVGSYFGSSGKSSKANEMIGNTAIEAVIGGTISMIGGGKFANGAQTGAFRYLFNDNMHRSLMFSELAWERQASVFDNYIMGNANEADMNAAYGKQFEKTVKNSMKTVAKVYGTAGFVIVGGPAISGGKFLLPILKGVYYRNAHHMDKVVEFIEGVIPGVPPASGAGAAGYIFSKEIYDPVESLK